MVLWNGIEGLPCEITAELYNLLDDMITLVATSPSPPPSYVPHPALLTAVGPAVSPPSATANKRCRNFLGYVIATLQGKRVVEAITS